jgi:hypothetical protein
MGFGIGKLTWLALKSLTCLFYNQQSFPYNLIMRFLLLFILSSPLWAQTPYVAPTKLLRKKGYELSIQADTWTSTKTVDENGNKESFQDDLEFSRVQSEVSGYYGATSDLQFGFGVRYRQNRATILSAGNEPETASGAGVESTFASIKYAFPPVDKLQYTLEGLFRFITHSPNEINLASDDLTALSVGDEGNQMSGGLGLTYNGDNHKYFTIRGGYRKAGSHISDELYYQLEGALAWTSFALLAGADGVSSMNNDPYESDPASRPSFWYGPTRLYNQENREFIAPYVGLNIAFGKSWRAELRGSQVVSGRSTDFGSAFSFALVRREDKSEVRLVDSRFKTYDIEATVSKVSPEQKYVVIDKGLADDVQKGMRFDFYEFDYIGGNILVASGVVLSTKSDTAVVKIVQRYNARKELKSGLIGRSTLK